MKKVLLITTLISLFLHKSKTVRGESIDSLLKLVSFNVQQTSNNQIVLFWEIYKETNTNNYVVERSRDAQTFVPVLNVDGVINNGEPGNYTAIDSKPMLGVNYYRIKKIDYNGNFCYSETLSVYFEPKEDDTKIRLFPNPSRGENVKLELSGFGFKENVNILVKDIFGQVYLSNQVKVNSGGYLTWNLPNDIPKGTYLINVFNNYNMYYEKLIIK